MDNPQVEEIIAIPSNLVGLVIGKGGSERKQIQEKSGAIFHVQPNNDGSGSQQCTIRGSAESVEHAKQLINDVITRAHARRSGEFKSGASSGINEPPSNTTTYEMLIPGDKCGLVIGKSGETIRKLQEQSGVKMQLVKSDSDDKPLRMTGDPEKIEIAKKLVQDLLSSREELSKARRSGGFESDGSGGIDHSPLNPNTYEMLIPESKCGLVIGKLGETIRNLQDQSGVKMELRRVADKLKPLRMTGDPEQILIAKRLVEELLNSREQQAREMTQARRSQQDHMQAGYNGGFGSAGSGGIYKPSPSNTVTREMPIPGSMCGLVIGKSGGTIRKLQEESGVKMELRKENDSDDKTLRMTGDPEKMYFAKRLVEKLLDSQEELFKENVYVLRSSMGKIIGKGGSVIKSLQEQSGAKIYTPQNGSEEFVLQGTQVQIRRARHFIKEILEKEQEEKDNQGKVTIGIPGHGIGKIVGKKFCNIKTIQDKTSTKIKIEDRHESYLQFNAVISGHYLHVREAVELFEDLLRSFYNAERERQIEKEERQEAWEMAKAEERERRYQEKRNRVHMKPCGGDSGLVKAQETFLREYDETKNRQQAQEIKKIAQETGVKIQTRIARYEAFEDMKYAWFEGRPVQVEGAVKKFRTAFKRHE